MKRKLILVGITAVITTSILTGCKNTIKDNSALKSSNYASIPSTGLSNSDDNQSLSISSINVSVDDAIKIYRECYPNSDITNIELDQSYGTYYYKMKGVDDVTEYQISINGEDGKSIKKREKSLDNDEKNGVNRKKNTIDLNQLISIKEAAKIAEENVGGGTAEELELSKELGVTYWEITLRDHSRESSVKLDAKNGKVLETELDD